MTLILRRALSTLVLIGLLAPASVGVCAVFEDSHCGTQAAMSDHACCNNTRISQCGCADAGPGSHQSEPARRITPASPDLQAVLINGDLPTGTPWLQKRSRPESSPPHLAASDRLTLLSTLIV